MEIDLTNKPPVPDYTTSRQIFAEHLDQSPSALVNSPTQASITLLRDQVLDESTLHSSSVAKMLAMIDQWNATQPISKLPLELITRIVALGFPITHYFGEIAEELPCHYMKAVASLATISRTWRNAIIGTPSLWGLLSTSLPLHINRISLERSGTCPLMIVIISWPDGPNPSSAEELLDIALPHRDRWSHAQLGYIPLPRIMEYLTSAAPRIEAFYFAEDPHEVEVDLEPIDLFGGYAPSLEDVWVTGAQIRWGSEVFRGLRKFRLQTIEAIAADDVLTVLSASPLLELLSIEDADVGFTPLPPSSTRTPIQLPHLKSIILDSVCVEAVGNILPFISAPNCDTFQLYSFRESDDPFDLTDFLSRSLGHFNAFIRSTLALHGSSQLCLYPDFIQWVSKEPISDAPSYFSFEIPSKMNLTIPWISQFLGSELLRPAHRLNVLSKLGAVDPETLIGLQTLALLPNVHSFRVDLTLQPAGLVLDLLGGANKDARGPAFPGLKEFRIEGTYGSLRDLETMLMRRYGESGQSVTGPPPIRIVLGPPFRRPVLGPSHTRLQFEDLRRVRAVHGVESVTLLSSFGRDGMPACIYDSAEHESCNPL